MRIALSVALLLSTAMARAESLTASFPPGSGSRFTFASPYGTGELVVSIAASTPARLTVECAFAVGAHELWQAFVIDAASRPPVVVGGFLLTGGARAPERIPPELLRGVDTFALDELLLGDRAALERFRIGDEQIVVPASPTPIRATRYERTKGDQTLTFWLSDDARPIGLVRLVSRGARASQSYTLELRALLKNVGRKIDPAKAVPLKPENRALFEPGR